MKDKKTLILVTNSHHAIWYDFVRPPKKLEEYKTEQAQYQDNEGFFQKGPIGTNSGSPPPKPIDNIWQEETKHHTKAVGEKTKSLIADKGFEQLIFMVPSTIKAMLRKELRGILPALDMHLIEGNYTHHSPTELQHLAEKSKDSTIKQIAVSIINKIKR